MDCFQVLFFLYFLYFKVLLLVLEELVLEHGCLAPILIGVGNYTDCAAVVYALNSSNYHCEGYNYIISTRLPSHQKWTKRCFYIYQTLCTTLNMLLLENDMQVMNNKFCYLRCQTASTKILIKPISAGKVQVLMSSSGEYLQCPAPCLYSPLANSKDQVGMRMSKCGLNAFGTSLLRILEPRRCNIFMAYGSNRAPEHNSSGKKKQSFKRVVVT